MLNLYWLRRENLEHETTEKLRLQKYMADGEQLQIA